MLLRVTMATSIVINIFSQDCRCCLGLFLIKRCNEKRRPIASQLDQCKSSRVLPSGRLVSWLFRFLIPKLNCLSLLGKCHLRGCLVPRRLKCGKQKTQLHEPSRSTAQWTMGTFSVDAKDSGKNPSRSRIR